MLSKGIKLGRFEGFERNREAKPVQLVEVALEITDANPIGRPLSRVRASLGQGKGAAPGYRPARRCGRHTLSKLPQLL